MRTSCSQSEIKHVSLANKVVVPGATLTLLSCSPNFPRASITRYTHDKDEPILKYSPFGVNTVIAFSDSAGNWLLQLSLVQHSISHRRRVSPSSLKNPPIPKHASFLPEKK